MDAAEPIDNGRYRLVELLGTGGMASVYRAWDTRLSAWRAVKVLQPRAAASASIRSRFEDEARAMARLQHRNVLTVHDYGFDGDRPWIAMELVPGGSLMDLVAREGPLRPGLATDVMAQVLDALELAHASHVVHRDVKPHNILLTADGTPLLGDFGVARMGGDLESDRTRTGAGM
ncbi:MAG: serine/threonine protein kinase, partial [Myxococcales bacterium]|nr:serine/threonine protein kinase [Myxococcales bacterium]